MAGCRSVAVWVEAGAGVIDLHSPALVGVLEAHQHEMGSSMFADIGQCLDRDPVEDDTRLRRRPSPSAGLRSLLLNCWRRRPAAAIAWMLSSWISEAIRKRSVS